MLDRSEAKEELTRVQLSLPAISTVDVPSALHMSNIRTQTAGMPWKARKQLAASRRIRSCNAGVIRVSPGQLQCNYSALFDLPGFGITQSVGIT